MQSRNKEYEARCMHALKWAYRGYIQARQKAMLRCKETVGMQYTSL